jgi:hypothetical protein
MPERLIRGSLGATGHAGAAVKRHQALHNDAAELHVKMLALDQPIEPSLDRLLDLLVEVGHNVASLPVEKIAPALWNKPTILWAREQKVSTG